MNIKLNILFVIFGLVLAPVVTAEVDNSQFTKITLAAGITVDLPKNWWLLNAQWNNTLLTAVEAKMDIVGIADISLPKSTLISLRSMPEDTYCSIRFDYYKGNGQPGRSTAMPESEIKVFDERLQKTMPQLLGSERILMWNGTQNTMVADRLATVTHYLRTGPKGPVMVWIHDVSLLNGDSLTIDSAMRASEADLWEAVLKKCIGSVKFERTVVSNTDPQLHLTGTKPYFDWKFPKSWHSPRKLPGKLGFAQFGKRMMSIIIESTTNTSTTLQDLKNLARDNPRFLFEPIVATRPDATFIETKETKVGSLDAVQTNLYYNLSTPRGLQKIYCCITTTIVGEETFVIAFECLPGEIEEGLQIMREALDRLELTK
jgi:hypothetical protein